MPGATPRDNLRLIRQLPPLNVGLGLWEPNLLCPSAWQPCRPSWVSSLLTPGFAQSWEDKWVSNFLPLPWSRSLQAWNRAIGVSPHNLLTISHLRGLGV